MLGTTPFHFQMYARQKLIWHILPNASIGGGSTTRSRPVQTKMQRVMSKTFVSNLQPGISTQSLKLRRARSIWRYCLFIVHALAQSVDTPECLRSSCSSCFLGASRLSVPSIDRKAGSMAQALTKQENVQNSSAKRQVTIEIAAKAMVGLEAEVATP